MKGPVIEVIELLCKVSLKRGSDVLFAGRVEYKELGEMMNI